MARQITGGSDHQVAIGSLPKSAVQALYHAVTGKTENLDKRFFGNVIITDADIEQLLALISDQISHYQLIAEPTVTIVVKDSSYRSATYSSWPRYRELRISSKNVTSEVLIKIEFAMTLPETSAPQRCVISLTLDSSLPVISDPEFRKQLQNDFAFFVNRRGGWLSLNLSIDFVDFLVAKNFVSHTEEWFKGLKRTAKPRLNDFLVDYHNVIRLTIMQTARIGFAAFLIASIKFSSTPVTLEDVVIIMALGVLLMALITVVQNRVGVSVSSRIVLNFIPGVLILNNEDQSCYEKQVEKLKSPLKSICVLAFTIFISLLVNIASSYAYSWLTKT